MCGSEGHQPPPSPGCLWCLALARSRTSVAPGLLRGLATSDITHTQGLISFILMDRAGQEHGL